MMAALAVSMIVGIAFSAITAAFGEVSEARLMAVRDEGGDDGQIATRLLADRDVFRSRLLAGRVLSIAGITGLTAHIAAGALDDFGTVLAVGGAALIYGIAAEAMQTIVRRRADRILFPMVRAARPLELLVTPFAWPIHLASRGTSKLVPAEEPTGPNRIAEREVEHLIEKREEQGALHEDFAHLLLRVLEFKDTMAREVMVPRTRMVALDLGLPLDELVQRVIGEGHSRYPVYRERIDRIEGTLHAKDLFQAVRAAQAGGPAVQLSRLVRKATLFVPEAQKIGQLLRDMQSQRQHLAIVVDEFGGTSGLVTLEDILEEIVGEIHDEHDVEEPLVAEVEPGRFTVDSRMSIHDLGEKLGAPLTPSAGTTYESDSIGGVVVESMGYVPEPGESLRLGDFDVKVVAADEKKVQRLELTKRTPSDRPAATVDAESAPE